MFGLELLAKLIKILRSDISPNQIAAGVILGMIIGLTPFWSLHNLIIFILIILLKVNIGSAIFAFLLFSAVGYLFDPLFHHLGFFLLTGIPVLHDLWTALYSIPVVAWSRYNNTVVMGSFAIALLLLIPVFYGSRYGVVAYREKIDSRMQKWKLVQMIKGSKVYSWYEKLRNLGE